MRRGSWSASTDFLELARNSLEIKRKVIQGHMDAGLFPYTKRYLGTLRNHFSTIGINGVNETHPQLHRPIADDITSPWGKALACRLLDHVRARMREFQESDRAHVQPGGDPGGGDHLPLRPGGSQAPTPASCRRAPRTPPTTATAPSSRWAIPTTPSRPWSMQETLQAKYTGGTVLHLYMSEQIASAEACQRLVRRALTNFRLPYITVTPVFSICPQHGYIAGEHEFCPVCDEELLARKRAESELSATEHK